MVLIVLKIFDNVLKIDLEMIIKIKILFID